MKITITLILMLLMYAWVNTAHAQTQPAQTGSYGVCNCEKKNAADEQIKLKLNEDGTYTYINNTNSSHKIENSGTYTISGKRIKLKAKENGNIKKWRVAKNRKCVKSRKGLNFTRICLQEC